MEDSRDSNSIVDTTVGTIVWVRRRNGSWWPGRIISEDELSTANLLSPRSGTPVKLLGREDGSVDWYNIEKSKRVKPFRCGDFDESIEKAQALAGLPAKKREKYARREDAILHALELEKQQYEYLGLPPPGDGTIREEEAAPVQANHGLRHKRAASSSHDGSQSRSSDDMLVPEDQLGESISGKGDEGYDWDPEEEVDTMPRMRGLQDFGLRTASRRRRRSQYSATYEWNAGTSPSEITHRSTSCISQADKNGTSSYCKPPMFSLRRKRSSMGTVEDSFKKRDRKRPLTQVLESSVKIPLSGPRNRGNFNPGEASEEGMQMATYSERSLFGCSGLNITKDVPLSGDLEDDWDYTNLVSAVIDPTICSNNDNAECCDGQSASNLTTTESAVIGPLMQKGLQGNSFSSSAYAPSKINQPAEGGLRRPHQWPLAPCNISEGSQAGNANNWSSSSQNLANGGILFPGPQRAGGNNSWKEVLDDDMDLKEKNQDILSSHRGFGLMDASQAPIIKTPDWDDDSIRHGMSYSGGDRMHTVWLDVHIEMAEKNQRESVPMVLLASRLNKRPIVGHPVVVEPVDSLDTLSDREACNQLVWPTARRTARLRVPRHMGSEESETSLSHEENPAKSCGADSPTSRVMENGNLFKQVEGAHPTSHKETLSKKLLKKVFLARKMRTLSSIAKEQTEISDSITENDHQTILDDANGDGSSDLKVKFEEDGVSNPMVLSKWPVPTCIPVQLALSRIKEVVNKALKT